MHIRWRNLLKAIGATALLVGVVTAAIAIALWVDAYYHFLPHPRPSPTPTPTLTPALDGNARTLRLNKKMEQDGVTIGVEEVIVADWASAFRLWFECAIPQHLLPLKRPHLVVDQDNVLVGTLGRRGVHPYE